MSNEFIVKFCPFNKVECCFDIFAVFVNNVAGFGNNVEQNFIHSTKSKQIEHVQFVLALSKGRNFRWTLLSKTAKLLPKPATLLPKSLTMSKQHSTLLKELFNLQHSTMLLRHCCWCGWGFSILLPLLLCCWSGQ